jgi:AcrR family transcriptional regulator
VSEVTSASPEKPVRKQQQRSIVTQQKLLDAAIKAFSENGFKGTSTRDIAERAGVHHPLITYHFKNKDQLWRAAADQVFLDFGRHLARALSETDEPDPKSRFVAMIRAYVKHAYEQPAIHQIIVQESNYENSRMNWLVDTHLQPFFDSTVDQIRRLQDAGIAAQGDPALLYHMIRLSAGGMLALGNMLRGTSNTNIDSAETREEIVQMIVRVYLPGEVPARN